MILYPSRDGEKGLHLVVQLALGIINVFLSDFDIVVLIEVWYNVIL